MLGYLVLISNCDDGLVMQRVLQKCNTLQKWKITHFYKYVYWMGDGTRKTNQLSLYSNRLLVAIGSIHLAPSIDPLDDTK